MLIGSSIYNAFLLAVGNGRSLPATDEVQLVNSKVPVGNKQRLELTSIGKEDRPKLEPRILLETRRSLTMRRMS